MRERTLRHTPRYKMDPCARLAGRPTSRARLLGLAATPCRAARPEGPPAIFGSALLNLSPLLNRREGTWTPWVIQDLRIGCLSGRVYYTARIFGFGTGREVAPSVDVGVLECRSRCAACCEAARKEERPVTCPRRCRPPGRGGTAHLLLCCMGCVLLRLVVIAGRGGAQR